ncbi:MAG: leukotoxin LktA family filamentous adhesin, partial [Cyanobacteriota bacterium]
MEKLRVIGILICLIISINLNNVQANEIVPDGYTDTTIKVNANTTNVSTKTIIDNKAFNSFAKFNVSEGNIVNLKLPGKSDILINLVKSETSTINGILNSIKQGKIGGDIFFVNPYGITIGESGVINVGSLTAITPTVKFIDNFFIDIENPDNKYVEAIINNKSSINPDSEIINEGTINAIANINLNSGNVINNGILNSFATEEAFNKDSGPDISDMVNTGKIDFSPELVLEEGNVNIVAKSNFTNRGSIILNNGNLKIAAANDAYIKGDQQQQIFANNIDIYANNTYINDSIKVTAIDRVKLNSGFNSSISGRANVSAANIYLYAKNNAFIEDKPIITSSNNIILNANNYSYVDHECKLSAANLIKLNSNNADVAIEGGAFLSASNINLAAQKNAFIKDWATVNTSNNLTLKSLTSDAFITDNAVITSGNN